MGLKNDSNNFDNTLVSCGGAAGNRGFRLYSEYSDKSYSNPKVQWNQDKTVSISKNAPSENKTYRDICVIRHRKGDGNLYVYTNDNKNKFLFMIFTVILIIYQFVTAENHIWVIYALEFMMVLVMAPLKVFVVINKTINKKIMEEITDISNVEE